MPNTTRKKEKSWLKPEEKGSDHRYQHGGKRSGHCFGGNPPIAGEMEVVKKYGGLFVLGTERHEARRIDNQLRGRSGRQGDPGETQFLFPWKTML